MLHGLMPYGFRDILTLFCMLLYHTCQIFQTIESQMFVNGVYILQYPGPLHLSSPPLCVLSTHRFNRLEPDFAFFSACLSPSGANCSLGEGSSDNTRHATAQHCLFFCLCSSGSAVYYLLISSIHLLSGRESYIQELFPLDTCDGTFLRLTWLFPCFLASFSRVFSYFFGSITRFMILFQR